MEVEDIISDPSEERLETCTKDQLVAVAEHYGVELSSQVKRSKPAILKVIKAFLIERSVLITKPGDPHSPGVSLFTSEARLEEMDVEQKRLEIQLEIKKLEFQREQAECEREDKLRERRREDKRRECEREDRLRGQERKDRLREQEREDHQREREREFELRKMELELGAKKTESSTSIAPTFDICKSVRMVPPFSEQEVDRYFPFFERVATSLKWPKESWTLLLQSVLVGRALDVYMSLPIEQSISYDTVKREILRRYDLVPEAHRQCFRHCKKTDRHTYVEFAHEKRYLFGRWCASQKADSMELLRELILLEDFKKSVLLRWLPI